MRCVLLLLFLGCGARSGISSGMGDDDPADARAAPIDAGQDAAITGECPRHCASCQTARILTEQSCAIAAQPSAVLDGVGFLDPGFPQQQSSSGRIFAAARAGAGRVAVFCDMTNADDLLTRLRVLEWLGLTSASRLAITGGKANDYCATVVQGTAGGKVFEWPDKYAGKPADLAKDFDVVALCVTRSNADPSAELSQYVSAHGKGVLVLDDYYTIQGRPNDAKIANALLNPIKLSLELVSLAHWPANLWLCK